MATPRATQRKQLFALPEPSALPLQARLRLAIVRAIVEALLARQQGVLIEAGDIFFSKPPYPCPFFRLRLSSISAPQVVAGIRALGVAVNELAQARGERRAVAAVAPTGPTRWGIGSLRDAPNQG